MAPLCADPRQVVIALPPPQRRALLKLVEEIIVHMIRQFDTNPENLGSVEPEPEILDEPEGEKKGEKGSQGEPGDETVSSAPSHNQQQQRRRSTAEKPANNDDSQAERIVWDAIKHMQDWRDEFLPRLDEILTVQDSAQIKAERQARREKLDKQRLDTPKEGKSLVRPDDDDARSSEDVESLRGPNSPYAPPVATELTETSPAEDRREAVSCVLLLLLATGKYSAHSRALVLYLASCLALPQAFVDAEEAEIAQSLMESSSSKADDQARGEAMSAEAEAAKRRQDNKFSRFWKVGLASVAGAAVIGVTGGLAAPLVAGAIGGIMGGVGLGGVASFLGIFWMNGALIGALFGAYGAKMTGEMMDNYAKEVEDFRFIPLDEEHTTTSTTTSSSSSKSVDQAKRDAGDAKSERRLRVTIGINGWLNAEDDVTRPWRVLGPDTEVFALRYEMKTLLALGSALRDLVQSFAWKAFKMEILKRTVLATLMAALWPIQILSAASSVDNPFSRAANRSRKAGRLLADALANRVQGERPVVLVGYSLGAAAIHACLQSLAERRVFGVVSSVVLIGAPAPSDPAHWRALRPVVSGPIFNVYSENDMVLGFVYRMHSLKLGVAGLQPVQGVAGIVNVDLSDRVSGHMRYPQLTGEILRRCGFVGVRAGSQIDQDDVIRMKQDHAEGKLVDIDGPACDSPDKQPGGTSEKLAGDLDSLTISPPARAQPFDPPSDKPATESAVPSQSSNQVDVKVQERRG